MASLNKVQLIGRLGQDPDVRQAGDSKVASFRMVTSERYKDSKSGEYKEISEWHSIVAWGNLAAVAEKYLHQGAQVYVEGKIATRSYSDRSGEKKYVTEIKCDNLQMLDSKPQNGDQQRVAQRPMEQPRKPLYEKAQESLKPQAEDLPF